MVDVTAWVDARVDRFARRLGIVVADRLIEKSGLDRVGDMFGDWLLGLNTELKNL